MTSKLDYYLQVPTKQRFASTFRVASRFSFWVQLAIGATSVAALLLAMFSRNLSVQTDSPATGFAIFLATGGVFLLGFRVYWAFHYSRLSKRLQAPNVEVQQRKGDIIQVLRIGLIVSLLGVLVALLASELSVVFVLKKALAEPQRLAVYKRENAIRSLDMFVVLAK